MTEHHVRTTEEETAFRKDVKSMSYDDLMQAIRYLDHERKTISQKLYNERPQNNNRSNSFFKKRAA